MCLRAKLTGCAPGNPVDGLLRSDATSLRMVMSRSPSALNPGSSIDWIRMGAGAPLESMMMSDKKALRPDVRTKNSGEAGFKAGASRQRPSFFGFGRTRAGRRWQREQKKQLALHAEIYLCVEETRMQSLQGHITQIFNVEVESKSELCFALQAL